MIIYKKHLFENVNFVSDIVIIEFTQIRKMLNLEKFEKQEISVNVSLWDNTEISFVIVFSYG